MMKLVVLKKIEWIGKSRKLLKVFLDEARKLVGFQLWLIQRGKYPHDWKSIPSIGPGAIEIRVHRPNEHRLVYVAKFA